MEAAALSTMHKMARNKKMLAMARFESMGHVLVGTPLSVRLSHAGGAAVTAVCSRRSQIQTVFTHQFRGKFGLRPQVLPSE
jgi:hypothetical protein